MDLQSIVNETQKQLAANRTQMEVLRENAKATRGSASELRTRLEHAGSEVLPRADVMVQKLQNAIEDVTTRSGQVVGELTGFKNDLDTFSSKIQGDFQSMFDSLERLSSDMTRMRSELQQAQKQADQSVSQATDQAEQLLVAFATPLQQTQQFLQLDMISRIQQDHDAIQESSARLREFIEHHVLPKMAERVKAVQQRLKTIAAGIERKHQQVADKSHIVGNEAVVKLDKHQASVTQIPGTQAVKAAKKLEATIGKIRETISSTERTITMLGKASGAASTGLDGLCGCINELRRILGKAGVSV